MLVQVADVGSFSAAARGLNVPLATLSRKINELEALIGARLLVRTTRKLVLTEAGVAYVESARRILEQIDEAQRTAAGEFVTPKGELVVTAPITFGRLHVLPLVAEFLAAFPEINVRMVLADCNVDLVAAQVDMAVRIGALPDSGMVATAVGRMRHVTCVSPALLPEIRTLRTPLDLHHVPCVTLDSPWPSPIWRFVEPKSGEDIEVRVLARLTVNAADAAMDAADRAVGVTRLLHYQAMPAIRAGRLQLVLEAFEPVPMPVNLVHVARGQMPLKMRKFLDFAAPRLRQALADIEGPCSQH